MSHHPSCPDWDSASAAERRDWLDHASSCAECRARWIEEDPSRVFSLLGDEPIPEEVLESVTDGVLAEIESASSAPRRRYWPAVAAVAATLALAALLAWWPSGEEPGPVAVVPGPLETIPAVGFEVLSASDTAQVVDLTVGDTQVVMIFDEDVEL